MQVPEVEEQGIGLEEGVGADDAPDALPPERRRRAEHRQVAHIHVHRGHRTTAAAAAAATARAASAISPTTAAAAAAAALRLFSTEAKGGGGQAVRESDGGGVDPQSSKVRKPFQPKRLRLVLSGGGGCWQAGGGCTLPVEDLSRKKERERERERESSFWVRGIC